MNTCWGWDRTAQNVQNVRQERGPTLDEHVPVRDALTWNDKRENFSQTLNGVHVSRARFRKSFTLCIGLCIVVIHPTNRESEQKGDGIDCV